MKLDANKWKVFLYSEVFEIRKGFYNKKPEESGIGNIPFIGASASNQGVTSYHTIEEIKKASKTGDGKNAPLKDKIFPPHAVCVTNNGSVGYAYYHDEPFTCSHDVNPLYRLDGSFNRYTGLFVASVIMADRYRWDYGRKWRPERMESSTIKLPTTSNGKPDWQWMEDYIKSLHSTPLATTQAKSKHIALDISSWEPFLLNKLFYAHMGNGIDANKTDNLLPVYNYVSRNSNNNGIVAVVDKIEGAKSMPPGSITLALGGEYLGAAFVQPEPYYTAQNVAILEPRFDMSIFTKLFITTLIRKESRTLYQAFGRELNTHYKTDFTIKLPVQRDSSGTPIIDKRKRFSSNGFIPDWQFMENYIKSLPYGDRLQ